MYGYRKSAGNVNISGLPLQVIDANSVFIPAITSCFMRFCFATQFHWKAKRLSASKLALSFLVSGAYLVFGQRQPIQSLRVSPLLLSSSRRAEKAVLVGRWAIDGTRRARILQGGRQRRLQQDASKVAHNRAVQRLGRRLAGTFP
jgi:hypothetical protein